MSEKLENQSEPLKIQLEQEPPGWMFLTLAVIYPLS